MNSIINELNNCIFNNLTYNNINNVIEKYNYDIKLRNNENGIKLTDLLIYEMNYSLINTTKDNIVSYINYENNKTFDRTCYYKKELNIPFEFYLELQKNISYICNNFINNYLENNYKFIAIDGTNTNNIK
jgi:hypothetical protein